MNGEMMDDEKAMRLALDALARFVKYDEQYEPLTERDAQGDVAMEALYRRLEARGAKWQPTT